MGGKRVPKVLNNLSEYFQGCIFFLFAPPRGGGKYELVRGWGKKYNKPKQKKGREGKKEKGKKKGYGKEEGKRRKNRGKEYRIFPPKYISEK